ncbi:uncharacterized protein LOC143442177 [Arvicanthis niloticus]|uniref:uncharacterized protein LOC143442177 n=2 Tax=Arvicanthis niloticus TaxID=61156 RepID=UPI00403C9D55
MVAMFTKPLQAFKNMKSGPGEMARLVKSLLYIREALGASGSLSSLAQQESPGTGPSYLGEPSGPRAGAGPAGPGHHLLQAERRGAAGRKDAAPPHTCGSLPRAPTRLGRPSSAALGRCDAAPCPPEAALGEAALLPDPVQTASPVPGPGTTPAGGGCAGPGERNGAHRRLVIQPGPRAAPAGATREMLAGSRGSLEELSPRLALPPRPPGLRARVTAERLLKGAAAARTGLALAAAPTPGQSGRGPEAARGAHLPALELGSRRGLGGASFGGGLRWNPESSHFGSGAVCGSRAFLASHRPHEWAESSSAPFWFEAAGACQAGQEARVWNRRDVLEQPLPKPLENTLEGPQAVRSSCLAWPRPWIRFPRNKNGSYA